MLRALLPLLLLPLVSAAEPVESYTLPNGLRVALQEDHRAPRVAIRVSYGVGWRDGPPGHRGLPHLFEHLMFAGTRHAPGDSFRRLLERAGATEIDAETKADATDYHELTPSNQLGVALWLEADRMAFGVDAIDEAALARARSEVLGEDKPTPDGLVSGFISEALYPIGYPLREPPDVPGDINATTLQDVQWFGQSYYRPDDAILSVVGDFDLATVKAIVDRYFGTIVAYPRSEAKTPTAIRANGEVRLDVEARQHAAALRIVWSVSAADEAVLEVLARVLADGDQGRLVEALRLSQPLASRITAAFVPGEPDAQFVIEAAAEPNEKPETLLAAIDSELERMRRMDVAPTELARAVDAEARDLVERSCSLAGRAELLISQLRSIGQSTPVTVEDVRRVVSTVLVPNARVVALIRPNKDGVTGGRLVDSSRGPR